jgi:hypothetical protein
LAFRERAHGRRDASPRARQKALANNRKIGRQPVSDLGFRPFPNLIVRLPPPHPLERRTGGERCLGEDSSLSRKARVRGRAKREAAKPRPGRRPRCGLGALTGGGAYSIAAFACESAITPVCRPKLG